MGMSLVPEDRKRSGIFPVSSVASNLTIARSRQAGWQRFAVEPQLAQVVALAAQQALKQLGTARKRSGIFPVSSVASNLTIASLWRRLSHRFAIADQQEQQRFAVEPQLAQVVALAAQQALKQLGTAGPHQAIDAGRP
jgi:ABC-type sugar transport system ATPase subunit